MADQEKPFDFRQANAGLAGVKSAIESLAFCAPEMRHEFQENLAEELNRIANAMGLKKL